MSKKDFRSRHFVTSSTVMACLLFCCNTALAENSQPNESVLKNSSDSSNKSPATSTAQSRLCGAFGSSSGTEPRPDGDPTKTPGPTRTESLCPIVTLGCRALDERVRALEGEQVGNGSKYAQQRDALWQETGVSDRARLEQYYTSVRELEQKLDAELRQPAPARRSPLRAPARSR